MKLCNACKTFLDDSEFWKNQRKCKTCARAHNQDPLRKEQLRVAALKSYHKHADTHRARAKKYYAENKEKESARAKLYKVENKDTWNNYMSRWREDNAALHAKHTQEWREKYPERAERCKLASSLRVELGVEPPDDLIDLILAKRKLDRAIKEKKHGTK